MVSAGQAETWGAKSGGKLEEERSAIDRMLSFSKEAGNAFLHLEIKIGLKKKKKW